MRKIRIDFKRMKERVSGVIRKDVIILIIAILVLFYVLVQASVVPFWNKELETEHINVVYSDMTSLKSNLTEVAELCIPRSSMIHMGVLYPNRFLFFNPAPGAAGNLTVEDVGITGSYIASGASTHPISYDSSRIIYKLDGLIPGPKLVYEHGIIIWDWGDNRTATADNQSLINEDTGTVFIPVVNADPCVTSSVETGIFEIYPYSNTSDRTGVEYVTITLDTDYPELWQELLKEHINAGLVSVSNKTKKICIRSSTLPYISLPDQPAPGAVSSGIITFSKELLPDAVLTVPAAIMQNETVEKNVTSTPKVTPTPTPTARRHVSGGGGGGGGGSSSSSSIANEPPIVTTGNATDVSATTARLNMTFEFHDFPHVQVQFRYKAEGAGGWNETGWVTRNGSGAHTYAEQIANLSANTTYYFSALLLYDGTELNGTEVNFTTGRELILPVIVTEKATRVSVATATLNMVYEFNDYSPVLVQFRYKAEGASTWNETEGVTRNGSGAHTYAEPLANLSANTTYYFSALLLYDGTELNGTWLNFTTSREPIPPTVWTGNATNVSVATTTRNRGYEMSAKNTYSSLAKTEKATCVSAANVTLDMGFEFQDYSSVQVQFRYKPESATEWTDTGWVQQNGSGAATYAEPITNLSHNTTYYYMAMLLYDGMAVNGTVHTFTTCRERIPATVCTGNATNVSMATATLNMGFEFNDYAPVNVQFRYKAEGAIGWTDTGWVTREGSGAATFAEPIANLTYVTTYYFQAMLQYESTVIEGAEKSFITFERPIVRTKTATNITDATAVLNMAFDLKDYRSVRVQFKYKAEGASGAWDETGWVSQSGSGFHRYGEPIADLSEDKTYYFRALLLYNGTVLEGVVNSFTTLEPPTVRTGNATNITDASATVNMTCDLNDYDSVQVQFKYKAEGAKVWAATGWEYLNGSQTYSESITNLSAITTYYFKAQLLYDRTELEVGEKSFMTLEPPAVHTKTATNITDATATLSMAFDFNDYDSVQVQFRYKANDASEWNDTGWVAQNGSGFHWYSEPIAGLSSSTVYQFKAQLRYDVTEIEGPTRSFITMEKPKVRTKNAIVQKLPRGWAVTLKMDYDFKDYDHGYVRFAYKKVGVADWDHTDWIGASHSDTYDELIMGLEDHTTYHFYAQLKYGDENNINGDALTFKTLGPR